MTDRELMQQALDALDSDNPDIQLRAATALRAALAQPEQKPVAWMVVNGEGKIEQTSHYKPECERWLKYDATRRLVPLYTAPSQRDEAPAKAVEWQGLTDEEANELTYASIAEIEAKLKEKNGTI